VRRRIAHREGAAVVPEGIHPTAVIDRRATLGPGVRIGAFTVIGPAVTIEAHAEIGHHVVLEGRVVIGPGVKVGHGTVIGGEPQDLKFKSSTPSGVRVGADTVIREYVTVHRATQPEGWTEIGSECLIMATNHIAHDCHLGDRVIIISYAGITGHCEIQAGATVGGLTGMVPFTRVGTYAYVGGCAKVTADVPPYLIVDGSPATVRGVNVIGLRRAGVSPIDRRQLQDAYRLIFRSGSQPKTALERVRAELPASDPVERLAAFIADSRRGVCSPGRAMAVSEAEDRLVVDTPNEQVVW